MGRLDGKVAIVTGGASGLGEATAKLFANEGAKVVVADLHDARGTAVVSAIREGGGDATYVRTDVTRSEDVQNVVRAAERTYGKLNIMVANAGITGTGSSKTVEAITEPEWDQILNVNLGGVYRCFKYAIPALRRAGGGAMSATSSVAGLARVGGEGISAYSASKAAVISLVQQAAYELVNDKIRVNCVCPGGMETRLYESRGLSGAELQAYLARRDEQRQSRRQQHGELGKTVDPMEVAYSHLFLCSDEASFVTGTALVADGGMLLMR